MDGMDSKEAAGPLDEAVAPASSRHDLGPKAPTPKAFRWAALWVLPYLILCISWAIANPPGAAADEHDNLVKILAAGRFDIGEKYDGPPGEVVTEIRNNSIARVVKVPAELAVSDDFYCTAFRPDQTADCLPRDSTEATGWVEQKTVMGAYPAFFFVPLGWATLLADNTTRAFHLARLAEVAMCMSVLLLGVWQLTRWLGRGSAIGLAVGLTPMAVFHLSTASTVGLEIVGAAAVAAVLITTTRWPESLANRGSLAVLTVGGTALILSRQIGALTFALLAIIALFSGAGPVLWRQLRRGRPAVIVAAAILAIVTVALIVWEQLFDHPALTGSVFDAQAWGSFVDGSFVYLRTGVGYFGWNDTVLPGPFMGLWILLLMVTVGAGMLVAGRSDLWRMILVLVVVIASAYAIAAIVFFPIGGGLQGRHMIPMFIVVPMLAGVVLRERWGSGDGRTMRRFGWFIGVSIALVHMVAFYINGQRYAVGWNGPVWWLDDSKWEPRFGWWPWLITFAMGCLLLAFNIIRDARVQPNPSLGRTLATGPDQPANSGDPTDPDDSGGAAGMDGVDGSDQLGSRVGAPA